MSHDILLFASFPEAFLNLMIILLLAGKKESLFLGVMNTVRFTASVLLMLAATYLIHLRIENVAISFVTHCFAYCVIISIIYRVNFQKAAYSVGVFSTIFATFENLYFPYLINYGFGGMENYISKSINMIMASSPTRILQIILIAVLWKYIDIFAMSIVNKKFFNILSVVFALLGFMECLISYILVLYFTRIEFIHQLLLSVTMFVIVAIFGILVYSFIVFGMGDLLKRTYKHYQKLENSTRNTYLTINEYLKNNDLDNARVLVQEHIKTKDTGKEWR